MKPKILLLLTSVVMFSNAQAAGLIDNTLDFFKPAREFADIKLNSTVNDVKQLGIACETGTDIINGKTVNLVDCEDKNYKSEVFGLEVRDGLNNRS